MDYQGHEVAEKLHQAELASKWDDHLAEVDACLFATEAFFQERGIEIIGSMTHPESDRFTVAVRVSAGFTFMATGRIYLEEDLDIHRYLNLELWTLIDHKVLDKEMEHIFDADPPKKERSNSYSGRLEELIPKWREMEKEYKSMSYDSHTEESQG